MTRLMIWPDVQREDGHWLPAVTLAKSLKDAGYTVEMMGIPDTAPVVEPYQIPFTEILSSFFPFGFAREKLETGKTVIAHWVPLARGALDAVFTGPNAPELLVAGYFAALEALILHHKYDVPLVIFTTFLRHPDAIPALRARAELSNLPASILEKIIFESTGEDMSLEDFVQPLFDAPEIIPMPQEFDFQDYHKEHEDEVTYVEPMVNRVRWDGSPVPTPATIYYHALPPTGKVLYGVCGSQVEVFESSARQFFTSLIEMMKLPGMADRHLVLPLGTKLYPEFIQDWNDGTRNTKRLPTNVSLANWVPQQDILARAEAVFLHGGLATIKESIWANVPMVVVPMVNDQFENALRVQDHDLGVNLPLRRLNPENLRKALAEAKSSPWIQRATAKMRTVFQTAESRVPKKSVEIISGVVAP